MAKQYGLIVSDKYKKGPLVSRPSVFEDSDSETDAPKKPTGISKTVKKQHKITQYKAIEQDPTVYQYDELYDEMDKQRQETKLSKKDSEKKPKYICNLLAAAERRKQENERRIERQVQKEREAEGDLYKDKEAFVSLSYRKKLEERKLLEEQEKREEYLESIGDVTKQGNLDGFYRHLYEQKLNYEERENKNSEKESSDEEKKKGISEDEKNPENTDKIKTIKQVTKRKYRKHASSEDDTDKEKDDIKKIHLPSNLDADSDFSIDSSDSEDEDNKIKKQENKEEKEAVLTKENVPNTENVNKEDNSTENDSKDNNKNEDKEKAQSTEISSEIVSEEPKPKKPKIDIWKKRTVGEVFDAALERYFQRKALRESQG